MDIKWVVNFIISITAAPLSSIAYPLKQISIPLVRSCIKRMGVNKLFISFTTLYKSSSINDKNLYGEELLRVAKRTRLRVAKCLLYDSLVMANTFK